MSSTADTVTQQGLTASVRAEIIALLSVDQIAEDNTVRQNHGRGASYLPTSPPDLVVYPTSTQQVADILKLCNKTRTPVIPFGAGTSVEGHVAALHGGICMDLSRMNRIIDVIDAASFNCRVESGVTREQLNKELQEKKLFFSVDPGADATMGGMMNTRASGTNTVKYGTMRENVLGTTTVLANGEVLRTGSKAMKSSAGYDLTHLLCGSEGTLGVVTELLIKLHPLPESVAAAVCAFPSIKAAVDSATAVIQRCIAVARIELLDEIAVAAANAYSGLNLTPSPTLFFEFTGTSNSVAEQSERVAVVVKYYGGSDFKWEVTDEGRKRLWKARHDVYWAILRMYPNRTCFVTDVCLPISKLSDCILYAKGLAEKHAIPSPVIGHVGDGNFHSLLTIDQKDEKELETARQISEGIVAKALNFGGTCSGEHGIGYGKLKYLASEHGETAVHVMQQIKKTLDPNHILNPGKLGSDSIE